MGSMFVTMIEEFYEGTDIKTLTIRDVEQGEKLQNWTASPSLLEGQKKPNLEETEVVNLKNQEDVKETRISIHLEAEQKEELVELLRQYIDVFAWSYDDIPGLSTDIVSHQLPTDPARSPVKQKPRKFKPDLSLRIQEEVTKEDIAESYPGWRMFFDGASNFKGVGIGAILISESGQHYPTSARIRFPCINNMAKYEACIIGIKIAIDMNIKELLVIGDSDMLIHQVQGEWSTKNVKILSYLHCVKELCKKFMKIKFKHVPRIQNEFVDALATLSSMIQHPDKNYIDPIEVEIRDQHAYCFHLDE
uniref:RNase H type-1 domain-containing protein n=1 Tax=Nicotiana tabacum TaxID=4097 RepID=A0A1S3X3L7_TOBAC|nr:PREDICTED: uncharacterized protein LOC107760913 [Nicotiana tabacum]